MIIPLAKDVLLALARQLGRTPPSRSVLRPAVGASPPAHLRGVLLALPWKN